MKRRKQLPDKWQTFFYFSEMHTFLQYQGHFETIARDV